MKSTEAALYRGHVDLLDAAYDRLLEAHELDAIVIHSGTPKKRSLYDDQYWPLRPTPHFEHWIALGEPGCLLVKERGQRARVIWPRVTDFWERPRPLSLDHVGDALELLRTSHAQVKDFVPRGRLAFIGEDRVAREALAPYAEADPPALLRALDALRVHKTAWEIHCLTEANRIAGRGHDHVLGKFREGLRNELDLHLEYLRATRQDDWETPYKNIVALGDHASILHHVGYSKEGMQSASILLDAGASYQGYASDITRTWVEGTEPRATLFSALVAGMEKLQQELCAEIRIGMPYEALHDASHRKISALLAEAGVVRASAEEIDQLGISRVFYPHGLGHSLGLQCHDVGCGLTIPKKNNPFLRNTSVIEAGQTFTIEPGLYFIDTLLAELRESPTGKQVDWKLVDELAPFGGIRIEDGIFVAPEQSHNLTRPVLPIGGATL